MQQFSRGVHSLKVPLNLRRVSLKCDLKPDILGMRETVALTVLHPKTLQHKIKFSRIQSSPTESTVLDMNCLDMQVDSQKQNMTRQHCVSRLL